MVNFSKMILNTAEFLTLITLYMTYMQIFSQIPLLFTLIFSLEGGGEENKL